MIKSTSKGWIGVDLDGTLAYYDKWQGLGHIGEPIPKMVERVKKLIRQGEDVRIFTARVSTKESFTAAAVIRTWCELHLGKALPITCAKDFGMIALYDDRAIQVVTNTGERADGCI